MQPLTDSPASVPEKKREGSVLITVLVVMVLLAGLAAAMLQLSMSRNEGTERLVNHVKALYLAEAGANAALDHINRGGDGNLAAAAPVKLGAGTYQAWSTRIPGVETMSIVGEGRCESDVRIIEIIVVRQREFRRIFSYSTFGVTGLHLDSNAMSDSYDSTLGTWESQATNRISGISYALANGNVGTNAGRLTLDSNSGILGSASPGPSGAVVSGGHSFVTGSRAPLIEAENFPVVPTPAGFNDWINPAGISRDYTTIRRGEVLPSGNYYFRTFVMDANATVRLVGPATVVVDTFEMNSNVRLEIDATAGPVNIHSTGRFVMSSNTAISSITQRPSDLAIYSTLDSSMVTDPEVVFNIHSNSAFYGTIYGPKTDITITSNFDVYGSMIGARVDINSNARIHYDQHLLDKEVEVWGPYVVRNWRELLRRP